MTTIGRLEVRIVAAARKLRTAELDDSAKRLTAARAELWSLLDQLDSMTGRERRDWRVCVDCSCSPCVCTQPGGR